MGPGDARRGPWGGVARSVGATVAAVGAEAPRGGGGNVRATATAVGPGAVHGGLVGHGLVEGDSCEYIYIYIYTFVFKLATFVLAIRDPY